MPLEERATKLLEQQAGRLSLAVRLTDDFAPTDRPAGRISVAFKGQPWKAVRNLSGYHVFEDLPRGSFAVQIRSALYLDEDREVTLPHPTPSNPLLTVTLKPKWFYPFPAGATLVRGLVQEAGGIPVAAVVVKVTGSAPENRTSEDGRFVLYFKGVTEEQVTPPPGRRLLKASDGSTAFRLRFTHPDYRIKTTTIRDIEEGQTFFVSGPVLLQRR